MSLAEVFDYCYAQVEVINIKQEQLQKQEEVRMRNLLYFLHLQSGWIASAILGGQLPDFEQVIKEIFTTQEAKDEQEEIPQWKIEKAIMSAKVVDHNLKVQKQKKGRQTNGS